MLMAQGAGICCVVGGGLCLRKQLVSQWRQERRLLLELARNLRFLESGIRVCRDPVPRLLQQLHTPFSLAVLQHLAEQEEPNLSRSWRETAQTLPLKAEEREWLAAAGESLTADAQNACQTLLRTAELLERVAEEERQALEQRERVCTALCFSGSSLLVLLLL